MRFARFMARRRFNYIDVLSVLGTGWLVQMLNWPFWAWLMMMGAGIFVSAIAELLTGKGK